MATIDFVDGLDLITLDESVDLQDGTEPNDFPASEDNNDDDVGFGTLPSAFTDRLAALSATAFFPGDNARGPEAAASDGTYLTIESDGTINNLYFAKNSDGDLLDGVQSGLTVGGYDILLYTDSGDDNIVLGIIDGGPNSGEIAFAAYLQEETTQGVITGASIWVVTYTAIDHSDATDPDDVASLLNNSLYVAVSESIEFNFDTLASGQNDWNFFGDEVDPDPENPDAPEISYQVIVVADEAGQTVNTSKGGGNTTIGNSNQLMNGIDPGKDTDGEAMVFTFVKNSADELAAGDLSDVNTVNYDSLQVANTAKWSISQTQGGADYAVATMAAYSTDPEKTTEFFTGIGDSDDDLVDISYVKIEGAGGYSFEATYTGLVYDGTANVFTDEDRTVGKGKNADVFDVTITFNLDGTVEIVGLREKDSITYFTEEDHSRLILQNTGIGADTLPWDIGGFELLDGAVTALDISPQIKIEDAGPTLSQALFGAVQEDALDVADGDLSTGIEDDPSDTTTAEIQILNFVQSGTDFPAVVSLVDPGGDGRILLEEATATTPAVYLTSKGYDVTTSVSGNIVTGSATDGTDTWTVFTVTLEMRDVEGGEPGEQEPWLVFELDAQVDHTGAGDNERLTFDLSDYVQITDIEGDIAALAAPLTATIENDVPEDNAGTETALVKEDGLSTTIEATDASEGIPGDGTSDEITAAANASVADLVTSGADEDVTWAFTSDGLAALNALPLTSKDSDVIWSIDGNQLLAKVGGTTILTVTLASDGGYTVDLDDQFDHDVDLGSETLAYYSDGGDPTDPDLKVLNIDLSAVLAATDEDGDSATPDTGSFVLGIENDVPEDNAGTETALVKEDGLSTTIEATDASEGIPGDGTSDEITAAANASVADLVTSGADEDVTWAFTSDGLAALNALPLTSKDSDVIWSIDGNQLLAKVGGTTILTVTLASDGGYTVDLDDQFDHDVDLGSETLAYYSDGGDPTDPDLKVLNIDLSAVLAATDEDGDSATPDTGSFVLGIENDVPEDNAGTETALVKEDGLSTTIEATDASEGIPGDGTSDEITAAANASVADLVTSGADEDVTWAFTSDGLAALNALPLTSKDSDVIWSIDGNQLLAKVGGTTILTVTLASDGGYTVDLDDQFDHDVDLGSETLAYYSDGGDPTDPDLKVLNIDLSAVLAATDEDGDSATPDTGSFVLGIENDVPEDNAGTETALVKEDGLSTTIEATDASEGIPGDGTSDEITAAANASVADLVTSGADEDVTWAFTSDGLAALNALPLTSKDSDVIWSIDGNQLLAKVGGTTILTVTLASDGGYTVDLDDQFDHDVDLGSETLAYYSDGGDPTDPDLKVLNIDLSAVLAATDEDGDSATPDTGSFVLGIENDVPEDNAGTETALVKEDGLSTTIEATDASEGIPGDGTSDEITAAANASVADLVTSGADEDVTWAFTSDGLAALNALPLTSKDSDVIWSIDGNQLLAKVGGTTILTVTLASDGGYTVDLDDQFDHDVDLGSETLAYYSDGGDPTDPDLKVLNIDLSAVLAATDEDGDSATPDTGSFVLGIENDVPTIGTISDLTIDFTSIDGPNPIENDGESTKSATTTIPSSSGADEPSSFAFVASTIEVSVVTGLTTAIVDDGDRVVWYVDDGTAGYIEGDDTLYFDATINQTTGEITFESYRDPEPPELEFDFSGFPAGNQIYGVFGPTTGGTSDALLVAPDGLVLKANGTLNNSQSTTLNSSLSDGSITALAVSNNSINPGEVLNFVSIASPPSEVVVGATDFDGGNYKDADSLAYTGTIERTGASIEVAQTTPNGSLVDLQITAYDIADGAITAGTADNGFLQDLSAGGLGVKIDTVTVYDGVADAGGVVVAYFVWDPGADSGNGAFVNADSPLDAPQDDDDGAIDILPGMTVTETADGGIIITNVADDFVIEWTQEDGADLWAVENVDTGDGLDIGGFNFTQAQPTPDQWFTAQVEVTDADGDTDLAVASNFYVDGTGIYDNDQFLII